MNVSIAKTIWLCVGLALATGSHADKPHDKHNKDKQAATASVAGGGYFTDERIRVVRDYYSHNKPGKGCPPGLAKKNNGCQPPGQAKKWQRGERLPRDVYYDIPDALSHDLGRTPEGQKVVRVGADLFLIAIATGTIIDAVHDLNDVF